LIGKVTAQTILAISPAAAALIPQNAFFDSVTLQLRYNFYSYGFTGEKTHSFAVHSLLDTLDRSSKRYDYSDVVPYNPTPMSYLAPDETVKESRTSITVRYDSLRKQFLLGSSAQDTLLTTIRLGDDFGQRLFTLAQSYTFSGGSSSLIAAQYRDFSSLVKGLAIVPESDQGILGIRYDNFTRVTLHYHAFTNGVKDTLSRSYAVGGSTFTNVNTDRTGTDAAGMMLYQNTSSDAFGNRYVQGASGLLTKIDLDKFYEFIDTVGNIIVNEAELVLGGAQSATGLESHSSLSIKLMRPDNQFVNGNVRADSAYLRNYVLLESGTLHAFVQTDEPTSTASRAVLGFDSDEGRFSGYMTLFAQSLIRYANRPDALPQYRVQHLAVFPNSPAAGYAVNRSQFDASQVKLRIYYTKPNITSNQ
jgi:hypothetical protein